MRNVRARDARAAIGYLMLAGSLLLATNGVSAAPIVVIDQQNLASDATVGNSDLGQSFTPSLAGLDAVELTTGGAKNLLNETIDILLGDGFGGLSIATSLPLTGAFSAGSVLHFDFASTVPLIPGNIYTIATSLSSLLHHGTSADTYTGGRMWVNGVGGFSPTNTDLVFTEGLHAVPEPASLALLGIGLAGLRFARTQPKRGRFASALKAS